MDTMHNNHTLEDVEIDSREWELLERGLVASDQFDEHGNFIATT
jgi:hypothetical protein